MATAGNTDLSANFTIRKSSQADLSANFLVGIDLHAYVKQFRFGHDETSTEDLHNELTIWLNSQSLVNTTIKAANIVPLGLTGNFLVVFIVS